MSARKYVDQFLALTAAIAAAKEDATPEQLADLQNRIVPKLRVMLGTKDPALIKECDDLVFQIMGPTWQPRGQWADARHNAHRIIDEGIRDRGEDPANVFAPKQ